MPIQAADAVPVSFHGLLLEQTSAADKAAQPRRASASEPTMELSSLLRAGECFIA